MPTTSTQNIHFEKSFEKVVSEPICPHIDVALEKAREFLGEK